MRCLLEAIRRKHFVVPEIEKNEIPMTGKIKTRVQTHTTSAFSIGKNSKNCVP